MDFLSFKSWLVENLGFKIVALVVAVMFWFGVKTDRQTEVTWPVPLDIVPESDDETVIGGYPDAVEVVFSGTGKELLRLGDQNFRVRKVLPPGRPGPRRVALDPADVAGGANLAVNAVEVEPSVLTVTVDRIVTKRVPLRPLAEIDPAPGYELDGGIRFEPPTVTLIGARTILETIDTVAVDLSRFQGAREEIREAVAVRIPRHPEVEVQPDTIVIRARLQPAPPAAMRTSPREQVGGAARPG